MLLAFFWIGQIAAVWAGYRLARRTEVGARLLLGVLPWVGATIVSLLVITILEAPYSPWDVVRLAPSAGLVRGIPLYSTRTSGPILSTMYMPFSAIAYIPAALVADVGMAASAARALACFYYLLPIYLVCCRLDSEGRSDRPVGLAVFFLATLVTLASPVLGYSATQIHSDAPALGMAGMACWFTMRTCAESRRSMVCAACFAWLSVWSKQTMVVLPFVLPVWWFVVGGARAGVRSGAAVAVTGALVSGAFLLLWGGDAFFFNAVAWPGHLPWKGTAPGSLVTITLELVPHVLPFAAVLLLGLWCSRGSGEETKRWMFPTLVSAAMVPLAILGRVKKGGDVNSFSPTLYPLLLACAVRYVWLASRLRYADGVQLGRGWRQWLVGGMAALTLLGLPTFVGSAKIYARLRPADAECAYLRSHPGEVYFPWHPLAHLSAEGRLTHHAHSVWERGVAGYPVPTSHAISGIPKDCRYVCFPLKRFGPVVGFSWSFELMESLALVKKNAKPVRLAGLPDYECYAVRR